MHIIVMCTHQTQIKHSYIAKFMACESLPRLTKTRIYFYETLCPNGCEPSIETLNFGGGGGGGGRGIRADVNGEVKFL